MIMSAGNSDALINNHKASSGYRVVCTSMLPLTLTQPTANPLNDKITNKYVQMLYPGTYVSAASAGEGCT